MGLLLSLEKKGQDWGSSKARDALRFAKAPYGRHTLQQAHTRTDEEATDAGARS